MQPISRYLNNKTTTQPKGTIARIAQRFKKPIMETTLARISLNAVFILGGVQFIKVQETSLDDLLKCQIKGYECYCYIADHTIVTAV